MEWLKSDLHLHSGEDKFDIIPYSVFDLIDRCSQLNFKVIALTNHRIMTYNEAWRDYAAEREILLIPGVEANILGSHVVILNADADANGLNNFENLKSYKQSHDVFVFAPHPFYSSGICLRNKLIDNVELFDGIEHHHYYTKSYNPNRKARTFAEEHNLPFIANSDCHHLDHLGRTYSYLLADPTVDSVLTALRQGDVKIVTEPLSTREAINLMIYLRVGQSKRMVRQLLRNIGLLPDPYEEQAELQIHQKDKPASISRPSNTITGRS
ncbi:hypothetical protein CEE37_03330 [candidate division LCP-89 bacterium B3_LCP]|uniref:Polymerase/histidinol phosphatase N-terminal domain-containing protein n=1 Tax=candidate division LCP-89 bacterium B3_LCP TaxID=2012998 RepID=A0A532V317_UNCL8|nr:MAG: hypothetical protein CEE37_03330 [candidate division LCP-89 bacterium B3_LCP]